MTEEILPGGMVMVKIDGSKVKRLREQKGLTQLYVATAVQVTTDTISRWENKRYPSVKKENCLKLAETSELPLKISSNGKRETLVEPEPDSRHFLPNIRKQSSASPLKRKRKVLFLSCPRRTHSPAVAAAIWYCSCSHRRYPRSPPSESCPCTACLASPFRWSSR